MDLASIDHVMTTTRSVRKRLDLTRTVEPEVIQTCIEIALQAPNGGNRGRYHFLVVADPDKRAGLDEPAPDTRGRGRGVAGHTRGRHPDRAAAGGLLHRR